MSASFPTSVKSFTSRVAGDTIQPAHVNDLQDEVTAIQTALLTGGFTETGVVVFSAKPAINAGLQFPATQAASSDANTLDDYEEGSWTPTVASSGGGAATYTVQVGRYIKVGKEVRFWGRITLATKGSLAAGNLTIEGLPFTSENTTNLFGICQVPFFGNLTTSVTQITGFVQTNTTQVSMRYVAAAATGVSTLTLADVSATFDVVFGGSYQASA